MTIQHAIKVLNILIDNSIEPKKGSYQWLRASIEAGKYSVKSKAIRRLNFRKSFIANINFLISLEHESDQHNLKIYRSKHGTVSLIDITNLGRHGKNDLT